jgi:uncharacterized membrane protein YczE
MSEKGKRILASVIGVMLCAVSVALMRKAGLGTDPFTAFVTGIANLFHTTYGKLYPLITGIFLVFTFFLDKHYIGLATLINLICIGPAADAVLTVLNRFFPSDGYLSKGIFLAVGLLLMCFSASLYFTADLGVSAYDAMALIAADKKIAPFRFCRIGTDFICVTVGFFCGANIGVGTVLTAFCMGPVIHLFNVKVSEPMILGARM